MKKQWNLLLALIFLLIVVLFSIANVANVTFSYLFGSVRLPLILIILGFFLLGVLLVGSFTYYKIYTQQRRIRQLERDISRPAPAENEKSRSKEENRPSADDEGETRLSRRRSLFKK